MTSLNAPRAFAGARPHLSVLLGDDTPGAIGAETAKHMSGATATTFAEAMFKKGMKDRGVPAQQFVAMKGFEGIGWETAATEALRTFETVGGTYHRVTHRPAIDDVTMEDLSAFRGGVYVILEDVSAIIGRGGALEGVMFTRVGPDLAQGDEQRDQIQVTLWPKHSEAHWSVRVPIGRHYAAAITADTTLAEAVELSTRISADAVEKMGAVGFESTVTTEWNADLRNIVNIHANALLGILAGEPVEPRWQDGIPAYKLAKLDGPKGDAAAAALLRVGFVREYVHG